MTPRGLRAGRFDPASKRHYDCGYVYKELSLKELQWRCPTCGKLVMRDFNGVNEHQGLCAGSLFQIIAHRCGTHRRAGR
jgi:hypothetical protein